MCNSQVEKRSHEFEIKEDPVFYGKRQHQQHQTGRYGTEQQQLYMCVPQSAALKKTKKSHIERKELQYSSRKRDICLLQLYYHLNYGKKKKHLPAYLLSQISASLFKILPANNSIQ